MLALLTDRKSGQVSTYEVPAPELARQLVDLATSEAGAEGAAVALLHVPGPNDIVASGPGIAEPAAPREAIPGGFRPVHPQQRQALAIEGVDQGEMAVNFLRKRAGRQPPERKQRLDTERCKLPLAIAPDVVEKQVAESDVRYARCLRRKEAFERGFRLEPEEQLEITTSCRAAGRARPSAPGRRWSTPCRLRSA